MSITEPRLVHEALVYSSDQEFLESVVPFLEDGLAASHPTSVVLTPSKSAPLRKALQTGRVQLRAETTVTKVNFSGRHATGVSYMEFTEAVARSAQAGSAVELPLV